MGILGKIKRKSAWLTSAGFVVFFTPVLLSGLKIVVLPSWVQMIGAGLVVLGTILYFKR